MLKSIRMNVVVCSTLLLLCFAASANGQKTSHAPVTPTPAPAPAPATDYVNLADLLSVAGPFHIFLKYLESTKLIDTFQDQANKTEEGITLFVPKDEAFSSIRKPASLSNLTQDQLKSVISFHAIPHYYSLSDFRNLSLNNPIPTFAGGPNFGLNFTDNAGTIRIDSGWTSTKVISAVHAADPVAIYETDKVLLPTAIFGTDIPPLPPAPAPAPAAEAPAADTPSAASDKGSSSSSSSSSSHSNSAATNIVHGHHVTVIVGMLLMLLCR
ncbi:fasciclin-like arabinogalactan protein 7 [Salvia splendens]|uniref:fasciclin-like arabinogalactan protein 7 n=1 Tax=Salvia splendens TaxID=180675 RepID=UPI001C259D82|nr:fasciclin-like arabinogalactan protein 7 [Salvia splendens]XP_042037187.1 fasciclin-like arabinogalactan protein 7 [Salvia splendens]